MPQRSALPNIGHKQPLSEQAYATIKDAILNHTFKPGFVLLEESMSSMLGISKTPLRVALTRLESEKLVVFNGGKQAVVAELSPEGVRRLFQFRLAVEPVLAHMACEVVTDGHIRQLEECIYRIEAAYGGRILSNVIACELAFDRTIADSVNNEYFTSSLAMIHCHLQRFLSDSATGYLAFSDSLCEVSLSEHGMILNALKEKSPQTAAECTRRHLHNIIARCAIDLPK